MELKEKNFLKEVPDLTNLEVYLNERREQSKNDLIKISENFNIPLKFLEDFRKEIRKELFSKEEGNFNLATTFHLFLWEFYQYKLAFEKEKFLKTFFNEEFFNFFVYYDTNNKSIYTLKLGNLEISLKEIFNLDIDKKVSSYDFFKKLENKFNQIKEKENELKLFKDNLKNYLVSRGFLKNYTKQEQELIIEKISESFFENLLPNYFDFFNKETGNLDKNLEKINRLRDKIFFNENFKEILNVFSLDEKNYNQTNKYRYFIGLICILGGINHFGAEWASREKDSDDIQPGFYNQIREKLNLNRIKEPAPNIFIERYNFTEPFLDSLTLSIIFGKELESIIKTAAINSNKSFPFTPISWSLNGLSLESLKRVRILDFINNFENILNLKVNKEAIKQFLKENNYLNIYSLEELLKEDRDFYNLNELFLNLTKEKFLAEKKLKKVLCDIYKENPLNLLVFFDLDFKKLNLIEKIDVNLDKDKKIKSYGIELPLNFSLDYKKVFDFILLAR